MTIRKYFDEARARVPDAVFQLYHDGDKWVSSTFSDVYDRVIRTVAVVRKNMNSALSGIDSYADRIAIMLENCPDWQVLYLAIAGSGLVVVPLDPKLRATEASHILSDSGAKCIFSTLKQQTVIDNATKGMQNPPIGIYNLVEQIAAVTRDEFAAAKKWYDEHVPSVDSLASLIYTSGTTGKPKGAMLTHGNFTANVEQTNARVPFYSSDNFLNVLPLFHAFSFLGNFVLPLKVRATTCFPRSIRTIADDMLELKPTILLAVPLLAEKLYQRIESKIKKSFIATGMMKFGVSRKILSKKILERFGGRLRILGIGGAPTSHETLKGFRSMGLGVLEGYGITECSPGVAYPNPDHFKIGTVGQVLDGMEYKVVNQDETGAGELYVKGANVTQGYWKNDEQTAASFDAEGYYKTGDIVRIDSEGFVTICGRTKALIVNREGKNIYPEEIEQNLEHAPLIKDVIVLGYKIGQEVGEHIGAIVVPDEDAVRDHLKGRTLTHEELAKFIREYAIGVCKATVADYKIPRKIVVHFEPLERTPSMKVRRVVYAGTLDEKDVEEPCDDSRETER